LPIDAILLAVYNTVSRPLLRDIVSCGDGFVVTIRHPSSTPLLLGFGVVRTTPFEPGFPKIVVTSFKSSVVVQIA